MRTLEIAGKEYTIEYTIEASLYEECTEKVTSLMFGVAGQDNEDGIKEVISTMKNIPQTALTMFYAGLLEHHGRCGDGTVLSKDDAKMLLRKYFDEHKDDETGNFYGIMEVLLGQMGDDGFFKQIGLEQLTKPQKEVKKPQDHKPKATKATKATNK